MLTELRYASEEHGRSAGIEKYKKWADEECEIIRKHVSDLILAERERCAQVALAYARESDPFSIERVIATEIKNMIRRGDV